MRVVAYARVSTSEQADSLDPSPMNFQERNFGPKLKNRAYVTEVNARSGLAEKVAATVGKDGVTAQQAVDEALAEFKAQWLEETGAMVEQFRAKVMPGKLQTKKEDLEAKGFAKTANDLADRARKHASQRRLVELCVLPCRGPLRQRHLDLRDRTAPDDSAGRHVRSQRSERSAHPQLEWCPRLGHGLQQQCARRPGRHGFRVRRQRRDSFGGRGIG